MRPEVIGPGKPGPNNPCARTFKFFSQVNRMDDMSSIPIIF
jgi:hypothetical protein